MIKATDYPSGEGKDGGGPGRKAEERGRKENLSGPAARAPVSETQKAHDPFEFTSLFRTRPTAELPATRTSPRGFWKRTGWPLGKSVRGQALWTDGPCISDIREKLGKKTWVRAGVTPLEVMVHRPGRRTGGGRRRSGSGSRNRSGRRSS